MRVGSTATAIWLCVVLAACKPDPEPTPERWYHARLSFDDLGELPFFLRLPASGSGRGHVLNDREDVEFQVEWHGDQVEINASWSYTSKIEARRTADGELVGTWVRETPLWGTVVRKFRATPIDAPNTSLRFPAGAPPKVSTAGIWRFRFAEHGEGKGVFEQNSDGVVRGYIKPGGLGDIRFLAGNIRGLQVALSQFNGNAANLVLAEVSPDGMSMSGIVSLQNVWNEQFTATKGEDFQLVDKAHLKEGTKRVTLRGLDKYRGKPTLAIIFATWCSSCNDASPYLAKLYAKYHPRGLEMLGVAYDLNLDEAHNLAELDRFREKYGVAWELLQVPCEPDTWAANMPPEIEGWDGLPLFVFVRADGTVQELVSGWFGPATGRDGDQRREEFEKAVERLLVRDKG